MFAMLALGPNSSPQNDPIVQLINPLSPKSDQNQISPCNINAL